MKANENRLQVLALRLLLVLGSALVLGKAIASVSPLYLSGLIIAVALFLLTVIRTDFALIFIIFFMTIPFTLGIERLCQVLEISNFLISLTFLCLIIKTMANRSKLIKTPLSIAVFAFLGLVLLTYLRNPRPLTDRTNLAYINAAIGLMTYLIVSNVIVNKQRLFQIRDAYFTICNIALLLSVYISFTGTRLPLMVSASFFDRSGGTLTSGGGVSGTGIAFTCILFLLCQPSYISAKWIKLLLFAGYSSVLILSGSRSLVVMVIGTLCVLCVAKKKFKWLLILAVVTTVSFFVLVPRYFDYLPPAVQRMLTFSPSQSTSSETRLLMWQASWQVFKEHPILGIGYASGGVPFYVYGKDLTMMFVRGPHNAYVFIGRSLGIVGLSLFGWMIFTFFKGISKLRKEVEDPRMKGLLFFIAMSIVNALIGFTMGGGELSPTFYLQLGFASAIYAISRPGAITKE